MFPEALAALGAHAAIFGTLPLNQDLARAPIFNKLIFGKLSNAPHTIWQRVFGGQLGKLRRVVNPPVRTWANCAITNRAQVSNLPHMKTTADRSRDPIDLNKAERFNLRVFTDALDTVDPRQPDLACGDFQTNYFEFDFRSL